MTHFTKRPVVIEAVRWTGDNEDELCDFVGQAPGQDAGVHGPLLFGMDPPLRTVRIRTLEGVMTAWEGDWIIRGVRGEYYPCKPDIFEATYEPTAEAEAPRERLPGFPPDEKGPPVSGAGEVHLPSLLATAFSVSASEARRAIAQDAVRLDDQVLRVLDLPTADLNGRRLTMGKRRAVDLTVDTYIDMTDVVADA